ncbi:MAG: cytochrome c [Alphaproteobacteria bacterium]|nr:cytochrome c [Alphaproteobacteria bacterium]
MRILPVTAIALSLLAPTIAQSQTVADIVAGKKLALEVCAQCHFVSETQTLIPRSDAPPFDEIAADPAVTELGLRVFLQTPHRNMPDLQLSRQETDDVIGFILNMRALADNE